MRLHVLIVTCVCGVAACSDIVNDADALAAVGGAGSSAAAQGSGAGLATAARPVLTYLSATHVGQITNSETNAQQGLGMTGTDLGISYQRDDKLFFLFGDSWTKTKPSDGSAPNTDRDAIAWTEVAQPDGVPYLNWVRRETTGRDNGEFLPFRVPGVPDGGMSVPVEGVPVGADTYFFFYVTDYSNTFRWKYSSVLAHAIGDNFAQLQFDHQVENSLFQSVSTLTIGDELWIYGAGSYRNSQVHLACAHLATLADRSSWRYYNEPGTYLADERNATALPLPLQADDQEDCVGELSVRKHPTQDLYFMAYNCDRVSGEDNSPHHIRIRAARNPEGPWSEPLIMLEEHAFDGLVPLEASRGKDFPSDMYGPYLIPAWFSDPEPGVVEIAYTLSTWNPYQVQLVRTRLQISDADE